MSSKKTSKRKKPPPLGSDIVVESLTAKPDEPSAQESVGEEVVDMRTPSFSPPLLPPQIESVPDRASIPSTKPTSQKSTKKKKPKLIGPLKIVSEGQES